MKRFLSLIMVIAMMFTMIPSAFAAEETITESAVTLTVGENVVTLDSEHTYTACYFQPTETGTYTFSVEGDAVIGSAGFYWIQLPTSTGASVEQEFTNTNQAIYLGVASENANVTVKVAKTAELAPVEEVHVWTNVHTPSASNVVAVEDAALLPLSAELFRDTNTGFYHAGSADGPIVYFRANSITSGDYDITFYDYATAPQNMYGYISELKYNFKGAVAEYATVIGSNNNYYPLTYDIISFMNAHGVYAGWYETENEWMSSYCFHEAIAEVTVPELTVGDNAVKITDGSNGQNVTFTSKAGGTYVLSAGENGEYTPYVMQVTENGTESVDLPYTFTVGARETITFNISEYNYAECTINLVVAEYVEEVTVPELTIGDNAVAVPAGWDGQNVTFTSKVGGTYVLSAGENGDYAPFVVAEVNGVAESVDLPYTFTLGARETITFNITEYNNAECTLNLVVAEYVEEVTVPELTIGDNAVAVPAGWDGQNVTFTSKVDGTYVLSAGENGDYVPFVVAEVNGVAESVDLPYTFTLGARETITFNITEYNNAECTLNLVVAEYVEEVTLPELTIGDNAIEVTDTWNGTIVSFSTAGSYDLSAAEGEENADVYIETATGSEWVELPYHFELAEGESVTFIVLTLDWEADTIDLVLAEHVHALTLVPGVAPTCTENGVWEHYSCSCGALFADAEGTEALTAEELYLQATGHSKKSEHFDYAAPTCTTAGNYEYYLCAVCGGYYNIETDEDGNTSCVEYTREDIYLAPTGHSTKSEHFDYVAPTCTEAGNYAYYLCATCGGYYDIVFDAEGNGSYVELSREDVYLQPTGHSKKSEHFEAKPATCTEAGNYEYYLCATCGAYYNIEIDAEGNGSYVELTREEIYLAPLGHSKKSEHFDATYATCTEAGNHEYYLCSVCGGYYNIVFDEEGNGSYVELTREDVVILPLGHERIEKIDAVEATEEVAGNVEYWYCSTCSRYYAERAAINELFFPEDIVIPAHGHSLVLVAAVPATCTESGVAEHYACTTENCSAIFEDEAGTVRLTEKDIYLQATGHSTKSEHFDYVAPTCTTAGNYEYWLCGKCGAYLIEEDGEKIEVTREAVLLQATGHSKKSEHFDYVAPTCTTAGNYEYYLCSICGGYYNIETDSEGNSNYVEYTREEIYLAPLGHRKKSEHFDATYATCTEAGNHEYYLCSVCGGYYNIVFDEEGNGSYVELTREDVVILPLGHERIEKIDAVEATDEVAGNVEYWYCSACSRYYAERAAITELFFPQDIVIPAHTHTPVLVAAVPATCTESGVAAHYACSADNCTAIFEDEAGTVRLTEMDIYLQPHGHSKKSEHFDYVAPTCTTAGNYEYYLCSTCGGYYGIETDVEGNTNYVEYTREELYLQPTGHSTKSEHFEAKPATCTEAGNYEYYLCSTCGGYYTIEIDAEGNGSYVELTREEIYLQPLGHSKKSEHFEAKPATCTEAGNYEYYLCSVCGGYYGIETDAEGNTNYVEYTREEVYLQPHGHSKKSEHFDYVAPTCTTSGNYEYYLCSTCGGYYNIETDADGNNYYVELTREEVLLLPTGHSTKSEHFDYVAPTCTTAGNYEYYLCATCGAYYNIENDAEGNPNYVEYTREEIYLQPTGHSKKSEHFDYVAPTCTTAGNYEYYLCSTCGGYYGIETDAEGNTNYVEYTREGIYLQPTGHSKKSEHFDYLAPTCTTSGNYEYYLCATCGAYYNIETDAEGNSDYVEYTREEIYLQPTGHSKKSEHFEAKPATCTETGNYEYYLCSTCGGYYGIETDEEGNINYVEYTREQIYLQPHGHSKKSEHFDYVAPTCTEAGNYEYYLCSVCGGYYGIETDAEGNTNYVEYTREDVYLQPLGHSKKSEHFDYVAPTCTTAGNYEYYLCATCGAYYGIETDAEGNTNYVEYTREEIYLQPLGHSKKSEHFEAKPATCTEAGNYEYYLCSVCGGYYGIETDEEGNTNYVEYTREQIYLQPHGHSKKSEHFDYVAPTCTEAGNYEYYLCSVCGGYYGIETDEEGNTNYVEYTREDVYLQPTGHSKKSEHFEAKPATCTEAGNYEYYLCATCGAYYNIETDAEGNSYYVEYTREEIYLQPMGHIRAEKFEAVKPTCTTNGNIEYWYCADCDKYYTDRTANGEELEIDSWILQATGHIRAEQFDYKDPGCCEVGHNPHWHCYVCGGNYTGRAPEAEQLADSEVYIPATGIHELQFNSGYGATTGSAGMQPYYYCITTGQYYADPEGQIPLTKEDLIIPAIPAPVVPSSPDTADNSAVALYTSLLIASILGLAVMFGFKRKEEI